MEIEQEDIFDLTSRPREEEEHNTEDMREVDMEQVRSEVRKGKQNFQKQSAGFKKKKKEYTSEGEEDADTALNKASKKRTSRVLDEDQLKEMVLPLIQNEITKNNKETIPFILRTADRRIDK